MIQFEHVSKCFPAGDALKDLSFSIGQGEMTFLTGHSGAGKSTVLKLIALMERPTEGQILMEGFSLNRLKQKQIPYLRRRMGIVLQNPRLLQDRNVFNNVALPLVILGLSYQDIKRRVRAALDKVGLLSKEKAFPEELSSGEQQRVGIARAVVHKPKLILADEPTGNLDPALSLEIMRLFELFKQVGTSLLIASHDLKLLSHFPYRCLKLHQGSLYNDRS